MVWRAPCPFSRASIFFLPGAYFSASILDVKSAENVDFTDAQIPIKTVPQLCLRDDVKGTNPSTGVDTRDSLMCP